MKKNLTYTIDRGGALDSPWQQDLLQKTGKYTAQENDADLYDCLIVGGGITRITAALLLQRSGKQTLIAEAHIIGFGTTGRIKRWMILQTVS